MSTEVAQIIVLFSGLYGLVGILVAPILILWGAARFDVAAADSTRGFRLIVLPGAVLLWPLLLRRFIQAAGTPPTEVNAHRDRASAPSESRP